MHAVGEIVDRLNDQGKISGKGFAFTLASVRGIQHQYGIPSLKEHLRSIGYLSTEEKAKQMGVSPSALNKRRAAGIFFGDCVKTSGKGSYMFKA